MESKKGDSAMTTEDGTTDGEEKSVTLTEAITGFANLTKLSWWKRTIPYPTGWGLDSGEYIPQPYIQITANNEWWRSKLNSLSQLAEELRWLIRVVAAILLLITLATGSQSILLQIIVVGFSIFLLIFAIFRFRVVAHTVFPKFRISDENDVVVILPCMECGHRNSYNISQDESRPKTCAECGEELTITIHAPKEIIERLVLPQMD